MELPLILAGPILRRADDVEVVLWLATSENINLRAKVVKVRHRQTGRAFEYVAVGELDSRITRSLGERLWIHLIKIRPGRKGASTKSKFRRQVTWGYELWEEKDGKPGRNLKKLIYDQEPERHAGSITIGPFSMPTFVLEAGNRDSPNFRVLFGSCRKLHGRGPDASVAAAQVLERSVGNDSIALRPNAFFLMGDQIYADEISSLLIHHISQLGRSLSKQCGGGCRSREENNPSILDDQG